ncbi:MAG: hypothetical protein V1881_00250 [Candidatus Micrarchaeota archaeon]
MFWWLWLGMLVLMPCAFIATYAWNARLLGILDKKRAEKFWSSSMMGIVGGLILVLVSTWLIQVADGVVRGGPIYWAPFWATVGSMAVGVVLASSAAHLDKMGFDLSKQWKKNLFYLGLVFLAIGTAGMLCLMFPPNLLG